MITLMTFLYILLAFCLVITIYALIASISMLRKQKSERDPGDSSAVARPILLMYIFFPLAMVAAGALWMLAIS